MSSASPEPIHISREVARRFLLGRQGLWPGRRWQGLQGTDKAMRAMGDLQLDPLRVVVRAQDLALGSRVLDYREDDWARLTYERRKFFEWGGWLAVRPIEELPYYRVLMRRSQSRRWVSWVVDDHPEAVEEMRSLLAKGRELSNRHFAQGDRRRVDSYRGRKDSAVALYYLWRTGEAMVVRRTPTFERVYARTEAVAPKRHRRDASEVEADDFLLLKEIRTAGISKLNGVNNVLHREELTRKDVEAWKARQLEAGTVVEVEVEGLTGRYLAMADELRTLGTLARGRVPRGWRPIGPTTTDEVTLLSPLDPAIHHREQTKRLWDFDYKWGVYDKVEKRKFGYYDLPILWGDRLVGRADLRLDRKTGALQTLGLWHEDEAVARDPIYRAALEAGMDRLRAIARLNGAEPAG
ncbi:MAG TPA: crosslink repair DNA glycosylase YcaQ family protein [Candidatus Limnocylindrales bacterium]|nr:crosslink repair DNA glycosylase YcaQ family protein [Candidatus Limnocylindrales bacterium]